MKKIIALLSTVSGLFLLGVAMADDAGTGLGAIANNITSNFESFGKLIIAVAYVAGLALTVVGIFKFKQHKDNPQQVPMGTPITIVGVGALLIFFPSLITPAGQTIFGSSSGTVGGFSGSGVESIAK